MPDVLTKKQRSYCMSRIKGKQTKPETSLRKALWARGLRYRIKSRLPGHPDIVFAGARVAVFVDGCFWHRCPLHYQAPKNNASFWENKISANVKRDKIVTAQLEATGWHVLRVWEHDVKGSLETVTQTVLDAVSRTGAR